MAKVKELVQAEERKEFGLAKELKWKLESKLIEIKINNPEEFISILGSLLQTITKEDLLKEGKLSEKKCQTSFFNLELGIKMIALFSKIEENSRMMDAFIVILCNLLSFVENPSHPENSFVLRMIFRVTETIGKIAEFFFKKKHQINLIPIKNQMLFLLSRVVFKGTGKHDDFEGFMTCGTNDDMGDVDTAIRDMTLSIWLVLNGETKEYF